MVAPRGMPLLRRSRFRRWPVEHEHDLAGYASLPEQLLRNQFTLRQADELRVSTVNRQRGNYLACFDSSDTIAEPIHHANQIPPRRKGTGGVSG
jgi:hypothetical protein